VNDGAVIRNKVMAAFRARHSFADNVRTASVFEGIAA